MIVQGSINAQQTVHTKGESIPWCFASVTSHLSPCTQFWMSHLNVTATSLYFKTLRDEVGTMLLLFIYIQIYIYIYTQIDLYIYIYICTHTHTHTHTHIYIIFGPYSTVYIIIIHSTAEKTEAVRSSYLAWKICSSMPGSQDKDQTWMYYYAIFFHFLSSSPVSFSSTLLPSSKKQI